MKYLLYLGMFFLLLSDYTTAQSLIRDSCMKVKYFADFNTNFCIKSLEENPQSKSAKTIGALFTASAKIAQAKITTRKRLFQKIPKQDETPPQNCFKVYTNAFNSINKGLKSISSRDFKGVVAALQPALHARDKCVLGLHKKTPQLDNEITTLHRIVTIPVAFATLLK